MYHANTVYLMYGVTTSGTIYVMTSEEELRLRVVAERTRRGWTVSGAARTGGASHVTWKTYEETGHLTPTVIRMVASAFAWPLGWHQGEAQPPAVEVGSAATHELLVAINRRATLEQMRAELAAAVRAVFTQTNESNVAIVAAVDALTAAVEGLEQRLPDPGSSPPEPPSTPRRRKDSPAPHTSRNGLEQDKPRSRRPSR